MTTDTEAEQIVLGSMLRHPAVIGTVLAMLYHGHFRSFAHQAVFRHIERLWERGRPTFMADVAESMWKARQLEDLGPEPYLYLVALWEQAPTGCTAAYYADKVRGFAILRGLLLAANRICHLATYPFLDSPDELLAEAKRIIWAIAPNGR